MRASLSNIARNSAALALRTPLRTSTPLSTCARRLTTTTTTTSTRTISTTTPRRHDEPKITSRETLLPQTHYDFFPSFGPDALPPKGPFTLDLSLLRREFLQLQAKAHPDLAPQEKKRQAEALSARINEAYKTLQNPLLRAQYILELRGIDVAGDETAKVEDPELLMEVLETREVIEEAASEEELQPLRELNERRIAGSVGVLEEAFKNDDMDAAKEEAVKLRYWINIRESVDAFEPGKPVVLIH
ncbi:Co-chaperone Hsc20 [Aureobasidium pullulans]|nr:Co-chaperone Hsc20 [Aureobasidium pullulans]